MNPAGTMKVVFSKGSIVIQRVFAALLMLLMPLPADAESWLTYANPRFGTMISYPERFRSLPPPDNGDGQAFVAADGAKLTISGSLNINSDTVRSYEAFLRNGTGAKYAVLTYRALGHDWLVLSGRRGTEVYYERIMLVAGTETIHHLVISYPAQYRTTYDKVAARISRSMRVKLRAKL